MRVSWPWWVTTFVRKGAMRDGSLRCVLEGLLEGELIDDSDGGWDGASSRGPCYMRSG